MTELNYVEICIPTGVTGSLYGLANSAFEENFCISDLAIFHFSILGAARWKNYKGTGFVHPNSPIRQCSNECCGQSIINNLTNIIFA